MLTQFGTIYRPIIPAGVPLTQDIRGRAFYYVNGATPILVKFDTQPANLLRPGQGFTAQGEDVFDRIEISIPDGTAQQISFWAGFVQFVDNRQDQVEARTVFVPVVSGGNLAGGVLAPNGFINLPGSPTEELYRRKAVQIANLDPAVNLELRDAAGHVGLIVRPGETLTQPVSGFIRVANPAGAGVAVRISEIWWTL